MNFKFLAVLLFALLSFRPESHGHGRQLSEAEVKEATMIDARYFEFDSNRLARSLGKKYGKVISKLEFVRTSSFTDENIFPVIGYARYFNMTVTLESGQTQTCLVLTGTTAPKPTEAISPNFSIYNCTILEEQFGSPSPYPFAWRMKSSGNAYYWDLN